MISTMCLTAQGIRLNPGPAGDCKHRVVFVFGRHKNPVFKLAVEWGRR